MERTSRRDERDACRKAWACNGLCRCGATPNCVTARMFHLESPRTRVFPCAYVPECVHVRAAVCVRERVPTRSVLAQARAHVKFLVYVSVSECVCPYVCERGTLKPSEMCAVQLMSSMTAANFFAERAESIFGIYPITSQQLNPSQQEAAKASPKCAL
eukprot:469676-Pleurochrysis_carterae.AAC.4